MKHQDGYIMISVVFFLFVIATVSLNLNRDGAFDVRIAADRLSTSKAKLTAQAGLSHLLNQTTQRNCNNYSDIPSTHFGTGTYTATIQPLTGSPVRIFVSATMADGSYAEIENDNQVIYQTAKPSVLITTADGLGGDTHVSSSSWFNTNDTNYSNSSSLIVGDDILSIKHYALLKFDISSLPPAIKILSARLLLTLNIASIGSGEAQISAHRLLTDWDPTTASYNNSDGATPWSWPELYAPTPESVLTLISTSAGMHQWNLRNLIQDWVDGNSPPYGLVLVANEHLYAANFKSSNSTEPNSPPTLRIQYACECGIDC